MKSEPQKRKKKKPVDTTIARMLLQQADAMLLPGAGIRMIKHRSVWKRLTRKVKHES